MQSPTRACAALLLVCAVGRAAEVSPVQKVIELLEECKAKIQKDLAAEEKSMEEYSAFCDDEATEKGYAIKTAARNIVDLTATVEDTTATNVELDAEIAALGTEMAAKDKELANVTAVRKAERSTFDKSEKELMETIDSTTRAVAEIKKSMAFLQIRGARRSPLSDVKVAAAVLSKIVDAAWVQNGDRKSIQALVQQASGEDDLSFHAAPKEEGEEEVAGSSTGGILGTVEEMKEKAEDALTDARKAETKNAHSFDMIEQGLQNEIKVTQDKKADATSNKASATEQLGKASAELAETQKSQAADQVYLSTLQVECQQTAAAWEARQADAKDEMAAVDKAKEILSSGVKAFMQVASKSRAAARNDEDDQKRTALVAKLKGLARQYHSFALMEMVSAANSDPFVKIRGLIEDMISKLTAEANEEATQQAFCDEEIGKSKKSQAEKSMTLDKLKARLDQATTGKATLEQSIKELEGEVAEIDSSQAEATKIRNEENALYQTSSKDFKDSAEATEQAIVVLKEYYEGALIQVSATVSAKAPEFGSAKGEGAHSIISILEMAAEDFTKQYTEIEAEETQARNDFEKLSQENTVSKATKMAEVKSKQSEVKSLTVAIENGSADADGVSKELDSVLAYLDELKPQCESKAMSYEEKKQRRAAETNGLKEALTILSGDAVA